MMAHYGNVIGIIISSITQPFWTVSLRFWQGGFLGVAQPDKPAWLHREDADSDPALPVSSLDFVA